MAFLLYFLALANHAKIGQYRLKPEDIVINIGPDAPVPVPNIPGEWKTVRGLNQAILFRRLIVCARYNMTTL
jgi:hypothetical protein